MPENKSRAGLVLNAEKVELRAEFTVIAALGLFQAMQVLVELFLREKARSVNALELRIALVTLPIRASNAHQLECLNAAGRRDVRAATEVDELAGGVKRYDRFYS